MISHLESVDTPRLAEGEKTVRRIVIAGMHSLAGTWLVNACLLLLASESEDEVWTGWAHDLPEGKWPAGASIVRVNDFAPTIAALATHIIASPRDLRDAVLAMHRSFEVPADETTASYVMERYLAWEAKAGFSVPYEKLLADPRAHLVALAEHLGIQSAPVDTLLPVLIEMLAPSRASADARLVEQPGGWRQNLSAQVARKIEDKYWWWFDAQGLEMAKPSNTRVQHPQGTGAKAVAKPRDELQAKIIRGFEADYEKLSLLRDLGFNAQRVLDVGASNGPWSHTCAQVFPDATYYLVEALPELHAKQIQPDDGKQWNLFALALGRSPGEIEMLVPKDRYGVYGASALSTNADSDVRSVSVPLATIDALVEEGRMQVPDLVKLDVQGFELEVVSGGNCLWGRTEIFIVETSLYRFWPKAPLMLDVMKYFDERGYSFFDYVGEFRGSSPGKLDQIDLMFINRSGDLARRMNLAT